jgi:ferrous iron transport protein B
MKKADTNKNNFQGQKKQKKQIRIVLVGQPNCGKSTIFNEVAGYQSMTSNFPGVTVSYTKSYVKILGSSCELIDLPGIYSLTSPNQSIIETQHYLLSEEVDVIINVVDASILSRSLELTLQLMDLEIPMILCLNMIDEAERKGVEIDTTKLKETLDIPIVQTVASKGKGVVELFFEALSVSENKKIGRHIRVSRDVELIIAQLTRKLKNTVKNRIPFSKHLLATKLLENDHYFENSFLKSHPELMNTVIRFRKSLAQTHGRPSDEVISSERHSLSMSIFENVSILRKPQKYWKDLVDNILMHNFWGYFFLVFILFFFFYLVFRMGGYIETPLLGFFEGINKSLLNQFSPNSLLTIVLKGVIEGIGGGIAIVLPYLLPFLLGLSLLEDVGYLPRIAFLMDTFMHRVGLHGTAIIPTVLGYGCNVAAVMATRILDSPRDRFIASLLSTMVPCAARMTIIFGLVGYYLGGTAAFTIYILNLVIISISGGLISRLLPEATPGMMMEIPAYQIPRIKIVLKKTWLRMKEFIIIAWPLLIVGSAILSLTEYFNLNELFNRIVSPVTQLLGLPIQVGTTLIFGILRKELSMLMLFQALGTNNILTVMSRAQILVFTIFVVFYVPCLATAGVLAKQVRTRGMIIIFGYTFIVALILGIITRGIAALIW